MLTWRLPVMLFKLVGVAGVTLLVFARAKAEEKAAPSPAPPSAPAPAPAAAPSPTPALASAATPAPAAAATAERAVAFADLFTRSRRELDPVKRAALIWQAEQHEMDQVYDVRQPWEVNNAGHLWDAPGFWMAMVDPAKVKR